MDRENYFVLKKTLSRTATNIRRVTTIDMFVNPLALVFLIFLFNFELFYTESKASVLQ